MKKYSLVGLRFGRLLVKSKSGTKLFCGMPRTMWHCSCDCGATRAVCTNDLNNGKVKSCGCLRGANLKKLLTTHGEGAKKKQTKEYMAWKSMKQRCKDPNYRGFHRYGGRGITLCDRWLKFENFLADVGRAPDPKYMLDRIDNDGHYEPKNVRWTTSVVQQRNRGISLKIHMADGSLKSLIEISEETGIKYQTLYKRLKRGIALTRDA